MKREAGSSIDLGLCKEIDLKAGAMHPMSILLLLVVATFRLFWLWPVFATREETDLAGDCGNNVVVVVVVVDLPHTIMPSSSSSSSFLQEEGDECEDEDEDLCFSLMSRAIGMEKQPISAVGSKEKSSYVKNAVKLWWGFQHMIIA